MVDARAYNPRILSAATAVPPHRVEQREIKEFARYLFAGKFRDLERLLPIFDNSEIASRHFCRPKPSSRKLRGVSLWKDGRGPSSRFISFCEK